MGVFTSDPGCLCSGIHQAPALFTPHSASHDIYDNAVVRDPPHKHHSSVNEVSYCLGADAQTHLDWSKSTEAAPKQRQDLQAHASVVDCGQRAATHGTDAEIFCGYILRDITGWNRPARMVANCHIAVADTFQTT